MSLLTHLDACNAWQPEQFLPFIVAGERLGWVRHCTAEWLLTRSAEFSECHQQLHWAAPTTFAARSAAMADICIDLAAQFLPAGLHGELYPVTASERQSARFIIDRACAPLFGCRAFGQHLIGFIRREQQLLIWVPRRSANRRNYPNCLDNTVAGGWPWGLHWRDNLRKECWEEATIPAVFADNARPVGAITYCHATPLGLKPDVMYCYDLELPTDFVPQCNDDEVAEFMLWPIERVLETVRHTHEFKLNCNLVLLDFAVRHGYFTPDEPDYLALVTRLRSPLP